MGQSFIDGTVNLASLTNPGVYVDIIPPQPVVYGTPTNIEGIVGVAQWGPVGSPIYFNTPAQCQAVYGVPVARTYDMPTYCWAGSQQGNQNTPSGGVTFCGVRVTDGTDVAASVIILTTCITLTSKYTGSLGNQTSMVLSTGTLANSFAASISFPGRAPELFNNITGSGNTFWVNLAAAINNGTAYRGPSQNIIASAGAGTTAPTLGTNYPLSGGTDGATTITTGIMVGQDTLPRKGMYALRSTGIDAFALCDVVDVTSWVTQTTFGLSESCFPVLTTAAGDTVSACVASRTTNGLDYFYAWLIMGDWPTFNDTQNAQTRLVSPQAIGLGLLANLSPEQSPLNKQLNNVVSTQRGTAGVPYAAADIQQAELGGIDLIVPPQNTPGGPYYSFITGRNAWSNTGGNSLIFTRMTGFLERSFGSVGGKFVGMLQSVSPNDPTRQNIYFAFNSFMANLASPQLGSFGYGMIDKWAVQCDLLNNPPNLQAQGFLFVYVTVRYLNEIRYFVVKLAGGGNVQVTSQATQPSPSQFA
jgi:uncharacterized protein